VQRKVRNADRILARLATGSHGIVTCEELLRAGVTDGAIVQRRRSGALIPQYRGVYRVGHTAPSEEATYMASVKACGGRAGLSGMAAAWLWHLIRGHAPPPEVSTPDDRRIPGVKTRRRRLHPSELA
jgi:hypothetical protein